MFNLTSQAHSILILALLILGPGKTALAGENIQQKQESPTELSTQHIDNGVVGGLGGTGNTSSSENQESGAATRGLKNLEEKDNEAPQTEKSQKPCAYSPQDNKGKFEDEKSKSNK